MSSERYCKLLAAEGERVEFRHNDRKVKGILWLDTTAETGVVVVSNERPLFFRVEDFTNKPSEFELKGK